MNNILAFGICAVVGYLLGSISWSIILTRIFKNNEDIRQQGSGNAGMTNVLRSVGKLPAVLTFVGDFVKCVAAVLIAIVVAGAFGMEGDWLCAVKYTAGVACVLGHIFPVYYGFKGGKGIVSAAAMIAMTDWRVFILILATFLIVFIAKRIVSLASIVCAATYPVYTFLLTFFFGFSGSPLNNGGTYSLKYLIFATCCALFVGIIVLLRHRSNIKRLRNGEEKPVAFGKK